MLTSTMLSIFICKKMVQNCQPQKSFPQNCFKTTKRKSFFPQNRKDFAVRLNRKTFFP